jgi:hypothetical protein
MAPMFSGSSSPYQNIPMLRHFFLLLSLLPTLLWGQADIGLTFLPQTYQSTFVNPAFKQAARYQVALPSVSSQIYHNGFTLGDLTRYAGQSDYDQSELVNSIPQTSELLLNHWASPFALAYQHGEMQFSLHMRFQAFDYYAYPREAMAMVWQGNSPYLDTTVEIGPNFEGILYRETGLSASFPLGEKFRIGIRLNHLTGLMSVSTDRHQATVYTDPEYYQLTYDIDYRMRMASKLNLDLDTLVEERRILYDPKVGEFFGFGGNGGFSMDLGMTFRPNEKWQVDASMVNFGSINWNDQARAYSSQGVITFDGLDPQDGGYGPTGDSTLTEALLASAEVFLDTLWTELGRVRTDTSYHTSLPARFYLSGRYHLNPNFTFGLAWSGQGYQSRMVHLASAYAGVNLGRWLTAGATYTYHFDYRSMIGLHTRINMGPVQFFASLGNLQALLQPDRVRSFAATLGFNVTVGREPRHAPLPALERAED